ncbi:MAG: trigger factor [Bdellovibrionales bacterium]|jgi:trigger factor|nr:trigger factor [Bdellovibrionales bacterium]
MSYSIHDINGCTKKLSFEFEKLDLSDQINKAVKEKQKTANLKGFRQGKAPLAMVQKLFGPQIESNALNEFVKEQFFDAIEKEDLRMVGYPTFENMNYEEGKKVSFDAKVEIFPTVALKDMSSYSFTRDSVDVEDEEVEKMLKSRLESKSEMSELKDATLSNGHFAVMNFQGEKEDGERPENMKGEEFLLEIGSNQFIPGFEEKMIGMKAGEKKDIDLTFPADYHVEDLQNAKVKFEVEVLEIKEKKYPELSEELAKELGEESASSMRNNIKDNLVQQKTRMADQKLQQEILEKLIEENKFDVPTAMIAQQKEALKKDVEKNIRQQGFTDQMVEDYFEKWAGDLNSRAEFQVRSALILEELGKSFSVEVTEDDLNDKIEETAKMTGMEADKIRSFYTSNEQTKNNLMYSIKEEKTFKKLIESMNVK